MFVLMFASGCGYSRVGDAPSSGYQWQSLYREDVRSVSVPIFQNKTFQRGLELQLTDALVKQIESKSPYKVMSRERADTIFEGEIVSVRLQTVSLDARTALPQEQLYVVAVNFIWKDLRTGRILMRRTNFEQTTPFFPTLGEGTYAGSQNAIEKLALGIVQEMQADW
jgi:hypothetical protein